MRMSGVRRFIVVVVLGALLASLVGCSMPPPMAYLTDENGVFVLHAMPCSGDTFTIVEVVIPVEGKYYEELNKVWTLTAASDVSVDEVVLFADNVGYSAEFFGPVPSSQQLQIGFEIAEYYYWGHLDFTLNRIPEGKAMTWEGLVDLEKLTRKCR